MNKVCFLFVLSIVCANSVFAMDIEMGGVVADTADAPQCCICLLPMDATPSAKKDDVLVNGENVFECCVAGDVHHRFHAACLAGWVVAKTGERAPITCPICRAVVRKKIAKNVPAVLRKVLPAPERCMCSERCTGGVLLCATLGAFIYAIIIISRL